LLGRGWAGFESLNTQDVFRYRPADDAQARKPKPVDRGAPPTKAAPTGHSFGASASDSAPLTLAQCHEIIAGLSMQVGVLSQQLVQRDELLAMPQERLKLDSSTSSKPPSSDGPGSGGNRGAAPSQ